MTDNEQLYLWIGKQIAKFRHEQKISQTDLAELMNLSRGSIANIEKGRQQAPLHILWKIAEKLNTSIEEILPLKNQHIIESTEELLNLLDETEGLEQSNKDKINQFLKDL